MHTSKAPTRYRNDIDGLRAIAVLLVILFHAGSTFFPAGFIGVDIFFVISGYLISGIILSQIRKDEFSFSEFLVHRLWRIQPALIVVSGVTLVVSTLLFLPADFLLFLNSAKYNAIFLSNQFFARQSATYASPDSNIFPLLHTWSLSVEWQWYFVLPLCVLAGAWLSKRLKLTRQQSQTDRLLFVLWLLITTLLAALSLIVTAKHPGQAYYFLTTRAFEFTAGGSAFLLTRLVPTVRTSVASLLSIAAFSLLIMVALKPGVIGSYPNGYTLIIVTAAAVILFCGHYREKVVGYLLSCPPLVFIGKISYSLYLWHWPVFAFCRYMDITLTGVNLCLAISTIIGLSLASYFFIEKPLRRRRPLLKVSLLQLVILPVALFCLLNPLAARYEGFPQRLGKHYLYQYKTLEQYANLAKNRDACLEGEQNPGECQFGDMKANKTALLIGDSNSNHFWGFFDVLARHGHVRMTGLSASSCLTLPGIWQFDWWIYHNEPYTRCHEHTENYYDLIRKNHYDYVILGEIWEQYARGAYLINNTGDERSDALSKERMNKAIRNALNSIISSGARPIIIKTISPMPSGYQECLRRQAIAQAEYSEKACDTPTQRTEDNPYIHDLFRQLQQEYPALIFIDPKDVQCPNGYCVSAINTIPVFRDVGHLTDYASYHLGQDYLEKYGDLFK